MATRKWGLHVRARGTDAEIASLSVADTAYRWVSLACEAKAMMRDVCRCREAAAQQLGLFGNLPLREQSVWLFLMKADLQRGENGGAK